ncbi:type IV secretion protein Rhs [Acrocarpospora phusangensis]|uniref:Type IV secretion protein Rhs n=1 Tax=Acrocarpospora phusangensis TaxID=1070424 RepID=A0A919Q5I2_9ACTN|nr:polymorphic toxin-type HINT domain-containing protein [Acrocarpospora phusangensis]GIH22739.1 type IV secretion protein Rhs [Acrocarpospora phusangensis]
MGTVRGRVGLVGGSIGTAVAVFLSGGGVPPGLVEAAAAAAPPTNPEISVASVPVAQATPPPGREDLPAAATPAPVWPEAGQADVVVRPGELVAAGNLGVRVGQARPEPVRENAPKAEREAAERAALPPGRVRVRSLGSETARRLGGVGMAVTLTRADAVATPGRVGLSIDYGPFRDAHPAGFASRLGLVELPACALDPVPAAGCRGGARRLRVTNDLAGNRIRADIATAPENGSVVLLASFAEPPDPTSATGSFAATDLKPSGTWQSGNSGGDFSYTVPIPLPPSVSGLGPELALAYSSSSVDSLTGYSNNQAPWVGMGWGLSDAYIERRFRSCASDAFFSVIAPELSKNINQHSWKHWCWESPDENDEDSATIDRGNSHLVLSLEGRSSAIVKDRTSGAYKTVEDFGWKIEQIASGAESQQPYWRVTTQDGTVYRFGFRRDASLQAPYLGDDPGEPCHSQYPKHNFTTGQSPALGAGSFCRAPWRWYLDQEVDAKANVVDYFYTREENGYCGGCGLGGAIRYDRGGYLARVEYGHNSGVAGSVPAAQVVFNAVNRGTPPPGHGGPWFDDTPGDLNCVPGSTNCQNDSTAFYITKRLDSIVTSARLGSGPWDEVARYEFGYRWVASHPVTPGGNVNQLLWLDTIKTVGLAGDGPDVVLPVMDFDSTLLDNRADHGRLVEGERTARLSFPRVSAVANGLGGRIEVSYGQPKGCNWTSSPTGWDTRVADCYYDYIDTYENALGGVITVFAVYNKWLTTQVSERDMVAGSPNMATRYEYVGNPGWAKPFSYIDTKTELCVITFPFPEACVFREEDWDQFRGYQQVRTIVGAGADPAGYSVSLATFYRGMYDDVLAGGGTRNTTITDFENTARQDRRPLAGRVLQQQTYRATAATASGPTAYEEMGGTRTEHTRVSTGNGPGVYDPVRVDATKEVSRDKVTAGWRYVDTTTAYNADGLPSTINEAGQRGLATDNACASVTYARNTALWMLNLPMTEERRAGDTCTSGTLLGRTVTLYDGATSTTATPTKGNPTEVRTNLNATDVATVKTTYDGYGRQLTQANPLGKVSSTTFSPAVGWPGNGVAHTDQLGHTLTSWPDHRHGKVVTSRDADGHERGIDYDALGRTLRLWTPERPRSGDTPAASVAYTIPVDGAGLVTGPARTTVSRSLSGSGAQTVWTDSHTYVDGLGRQREVQTPSPAGGRIVQVTTYDARGLQAARSAPAHNAAGPGSGLLNPALSTLPRWTAQTYDGLARPTAVADMAGAAEFRRTTTSYPFADVRQVQPPTGGKTVHVSDVADQVTKIEEWKDATTHHDTVFEFDLNGNLTRQTDAKGNIRTFGYDLLGRRTGGHDPDAGDTTQAHDAAGNLLWTINGKGQKVSYSYDDLGRKTAQWSGEAGTGVKLAELAYDTLSKGRPTSSTRYYGANAYTETVTGYDPMGRPTGSTVTVPAVEGLLAGSYTFTSSYTLGGAIATLGMPAAGGLPAETITSGYTGLGLPKTLTSDLGGGVTYVKDTAYTPTGLMSDRWYGPTGKIRRTLAWNAGTGWLDRVTTATGADATPQTVQDDRYSYDLSGEITRILDASSAVGGSPGQSECFGYDGLHRLSTAFTTTAATCQGGADSLGIDPYSQAFGYDAVGNIVSSTEGGQTATHNYPASGPTSVRPNAVSSISRPGGTDSYGYDAAGQMTSRTVGGTGATFEWDPLGQLTTATVGGDQTTMVYDAAGERLIRREPGKTVLYLGAMELTLAGGVVTGSRYYTTPDGSTVAMRATGGLKWLTAGLHGSTQLAIDDGTGQVSRERYLPYGKRRGIDDLPFTDHGFLGLVEDDSTGLDYLSARYYDPSIGRFVSTDPLLDLRKPQWANPYAYAGDNPIGLSDRTGLSVCVRKDFEKDHQYQACLDYERNYKKFCKNTSSQKCKNWKAASSFAEKLKDMDDRLQNMFACGCWTVQQLEKLVGFDIPEELKGKIKSILGYLMNMLIEDAENCAKGDFVACAMFAVGFIPGSRIATVVQRLGVKSAWVEKAANSLAGRAGRVGALCVVRSSFAPGTPVLMADGSYRPIEQVKAGDLVMAADPRTGEARPRPVVALLGSDGLKSMVAITVRGDAEPLVATDTHPFWEPDLGSWVEAGRLKAGSWLRTSAGTWIQVDSVRHWAERVQVHNLTVAGEHTYFVAAGGASALVHNAPCGVTVIGHFPEYLDHAKAIGANYFYVDPKVFDKLTPTEQWALNEAFLDRAIADGHVFVRATKDARPGSAYAREIAYLKSKGYVLSPDGAAYVPPPS